MPPVRCRIVLVLLALALATTVAVPDAIARDTDKSWEFGAYAMASRYSNSTHFDSAPGFCTEFLHLFVAVADAEDLVESHADEHGQDLGVGVQEQQVAVHRLHLVDLAHEGADRAAHYAVDLGHLDHDLADP
ncbi:MAG: hypothetical protein AAB249_02565, partial [Acidobacteriota bacterium]